mmetsp:Transcript_16455/g.36369  ORF Transcript_16455/g.36369 Transcript_16455/m.36369 type:complete len:202 (-) Transcript_16455:288-893(-)
MASPRVPKPLLGSMPWGKVCRCRTGIPMSTLKQRVVNNHTCRPNLLRAASKVKMVISRRKSFLHQGGGHIVNASFMSLELLRSKRCRWQPVEWHWHVDRKAPCQRERSLWTVQKHPFHLRRKLLQTKGIFLSPCSLDSHKIRKHLMLQESSKDYGVQRLFWTRTNQSEGPLLLSNQRLCTQMKELFWSGSISQQSLPLLAS